MSATMSKGNKHPKKPSKQHPWYNDRYPGQVDDRVYRSITVDYMEITIAEADIAEKFRKELTDEEEDI